MPAVADRPLVDVEWLAARLDDPGVRIADTRWYLGEPERGRAAFAAAHIAGAVYVDLERDLSAATGPGRHPLPRPSDFAATLGRFGVGPSTMLVAYDDRGGAVAARLWWMARNVGVDARILDGGLTSWLAAGHPTTDLAIEYPAVEPIDVPGSWRATVDRFGVASSIGSTQIVDARSGQRYRGEEEPIDPVAGHIPTAINAPYEENLTDGDRFKTMSELGQRFSDLGLDPAREVVAYCGSGVTACHDILALELAGFRDVKLYPGSWSDWSTSGGEVATGG